MWRQTAIPRTADDWHVSWSRLGPTPLVLAFCFLAAFGLACTSSEVVVNDCDDACPTGSTCSAGQCEPDLPPPISDLGRYNRIATLTDGRLVIASYNERQRAFVLVHDAPTGAADPSSRVTLIDGGPLQPNRAASTDVGRWPSLAVTPANVVHLAWYDKTRGQLKYATATFSEDSSPQLSPPELVDGGATDRGTHSSIALSADGIPYIAYRDTTTRSLRLATRAGGQWTSEIVPACGPTGEDLDCPTALNYGEYVNLFVSATYVRIVFYDRAAGALKLAERTLANPSWSVTVLDGAEVGSDVGRFASGALDALGRLGVAYFDAARGALRFYHEADEAGGAPLIVDAGSYVDTASQTTRRTLVGQHPALVFDRKNNAIIVYLDATALELKLARIAGASVVQRERLDVPAGRFVALTRHDSDASTSSLRGAYGAWVAGAPARTELRRLSLGEGSP